MGAKQRLILSKLKRNKKGISSLFISIFIALLSIMLISTLYASQIISSSALSYQLQLDQEKNQESISLPGPKGFEFLDGDGTTVISLRVKNNGAIPVNIRALYIGSEFICDPSQNPDDDAFIAPGKEKWISFDNYFDKYPIVLNETTINSKWTITTERGTRSSEKGTDIYYGKPGETTVPQFYIGPMMIFFDMFNWRSENGEWQSGWTIPKTADSVTWRILVKNVDERAFSIKSSSFFYLVCNNNIPNNVLEWYISDDADRRYFEPGDYHYLLFNLDKNVKPQGINSFQEWTSCINFLVLTGQFDDGTDIGQTIPFEAVLVTPDPILTLTPNPAEVLPGEGPESQSTIEVTLADANEIPIPNALIHFYTNLGSIEAYATTDINGVAEVILVAGSTTGWATITASSQGVTETTSVRIRG